MSGWFHALMAGGYTFSTQYQAMLDWAAVDPSNRGVPPSSLADRILEDAFIRTLVTLGVYSTIDQMAFLNTKGDEKWSLINAITPGTRNLTKIGTPTFVAGWGWLPSSGNALDTNYAPGTHGVNYTQNIGGYVYFSGSEKAGQNGLEFAGAGGASNANAISNSLRSATDVFTYRNNESTAITATLRFTSGLYHVRRTASNAVEAWNNGVQRQVSAQASTGLTTQTIKLGAFNANGTTTAYDNKYIGFWMIGNGWAGKEVDIYNAYVTLSNKNISTVSFPSWTSVSSDLTDYNTAINLLDNSFSDVLGTPQPILNQKTLTGSAVSGYQCSVAASDGTKICIYGLPSNSQFFLKIDPTTDTYSEVGLVGAGAQKTISGCLAPNNGCIYCPPFETGGTAVIKFNPITNAVTYFDTTGVVASISAGNLTGAKKWTQILVGSSGKLYCFPYDATEVMVIDPTNDSIYFLDTTGIVSYGAGNLSGLAKWDGGVPYGTILFGTPSTATDSCRIDSTNDTVTRVGSFGAGTNKYFPAVLAPNGFIYFFPYGTNNIAKFNPTTNAVTTIGTFAGSVTYRTGGACLMPDGRIFACQGFALTHGILFDPATDTAIELGKISTSGHIGFKLAPNGAAYHIPWDGTDVVKTYFQSINVTLDDDFVLSRYNNKY